MDAVRELSKSTDKRLYGYDRDHKGFGVMAQKFEHVMHGVVAGGIDIAVKLPGRSTDKVVFKFNIQHNKMPTKHWRNIMSYIERVAASILSRDLKSVPRSYIARLVDAASLRSESARRKLHSALSPFFHWVTERSYVDANPFAELKLVPACE